MANRSVFILLVILLSGCVSVPELPNPKRSVVNDFNFRYAISGKGNPVVVFESGFATPMGKWLEVYRETSQFTTAFAYNRRGYEEMEGARHEDVNAEITKDIGSLVMDSVLADVSTVYDIATAQNKPEKPEVTTPGKSTLKRIVSDLRSLLRHSGMPPPYILVGHSLGGMYSLHYAQIHPEEVAGIVLVDSSHPMQEKKCREFHGENECQPPWWVRKTLKLLPADIYAEWRDKAKNGQTVMQSGSVGQIPLIVLSHSMHPDSTKKNDRLWMEMQKDLLSFSDNSQHIVATESGHFIQNDEPDLVVKAIKSIIDPSGNEYK